LARNTNAATQAKYRELISGEHFEQLRPSDSEQSRRLERPEQQRLIQWRIARDWAQPGNQSEAGSQTLRLAVGRFSELRRH
jgi:hypothetical protein